MNIKIGANLATFLSLAVIFWLCYGAYRTGQALPNGTNGSSYAATT